MIADLEPIVPLKNPYRPDASKAEEIDRDTFAALERMNTDPDRFAEVRRITKEMRTQLAMIDAGKHPEWHVEIHDMASMDLLPADLFINHHAGNPQTLTSGIYRRGDSVTDKMRSRLTHHRASMDRLSVVIDEREKVGDPHIARARDVFRTETAAIDDLLT